MSYVVEVTDPHAPDDRYDERWELNSLPALADRIEDETGWARTACDEAAWSVERGARLEDQTDTETGRILTALRVEAGAMTAGDGLGADSVPDRGRS